MPTRATRAKRAKIRRGPAKWRKNHVNKRPARVILVEARTPNESHEGTKLSYSKNTWRVRCKNCRKRRTLTHHPDDKLARPCWCGSRRFTLDAYRQSGRERKKAQTCWCDGWWFPHREGCVGCNHFDDLEPSNYVEMAASEEPPF